MTLRSLLSPVHSTAFNSDCTQKLSSYSGEELLKTEMLVLSQSDVVHLYVLYRLSVLAFHENVASCPGV